MKTKIESEDVVLIVVLLAYLAYMSYQIHKVWKQFKFWKNYNVNGTQRNGMTKKKAAKILNVKENASKNDVKKAYWRRAQETHPDHGGKQEDFVNVKEAYEFMYAAA